MEPPPNQPPNPYQPPAVEAVTDPAPAVFDLTRDEVDAFVGERADYYYDRWLESENSLLAGWNWAAAFFSLTWLLYRRMFREFFVGLLLRLLLSAVDVLAVVFVFHGLFAQEVAIVGQLGFCIVAGLVGNGLYLRHARRAVARARAEGGDAIAQRAHLRTLGETSWLAALVGAACLSVLSIAVTALTL